MKSSVVLLKVTLLLQVSKLVYSTVVSSKWDIMREEMSNITSCDARSFTCNSTATESTALANGATLGCKCDPDCWEFGDCCIDKAESAWKEGKRATHQWTCEKVPNSPTKMITYKYMLTGCPSDWNETNVEDMCNRKKSDHTDYWYILDIPVVSKKTGIIYVNFYCAICHDDFQIYDATIDFHCNIENCLTLINKSSYVPKGRYWKTPIRTNSSEDNVENIYFSVPGFDNFTNSDSKYVRYCDGWDSAVDQCSTDFKDEDKAKCRLFSSFVTVDSYQNQYKNPYCAKCHNLTFNELQCATNFDISSFSTAKGPQYTKMSAPSYSMLLDFNSLKNKKNKSQGNCNAGEVFDPLQNKCVFFYCGVGYVKKKNRCVPERITDLPTPDSVLDNNRSTNNPNDTSPFSPTPQTPENETSHIRDADCRRVLHHNFTMITNKSLLINTVSKTVYSFGEYELYNETSVFVCVIDDMYAPNQHYSALQQLLTLICIPLSLLGITLHIICYLIMKRYKNLPGKNILSLSVMLFLAQLLFLFINSIPPSIGCYVLAVSVHYCFLSTFFWVNVLAADVCRNLFAPQNWRDGVNHTKAYCRYGIYAWLLPALIVSLAIILDITRIIPSLRPGYGRRTCWFSKARGLIVFFALPLAIVLLENVVFFAITAYGIYRNARAVDRFRTQTVRARLCLYVKLASIMGLTWILGFVASVVNSEILWISFIILNALQGAFIFIAFTLKRRVIVKAKHYITSKCKLCRSVVRKENSTSSNQTLTTFTHSPNTSSPTNT